MSLTAYEKTTLHFYQWEYLGRGYYLFDEPVSIEPPYKPFYHKQFNNTKYVDDGIVPSVFDQITGLFKPKKTPIKNDNETSEIKPNPFVSKGNLTCFSISFIHSQDISSLISREFLNMLSSTENPIAFEVIGTPETIIIQITCEKEDESRVQSHLKAYFPEIIIKERDVFDFGFDERKEVAIVDFGIKDEFMLPLSIADTFNIDPLTSIIATLDNLRYGDFGMLQVIFQGVRSPWAKSIINSVSDGFGESFFADSPEMLVGAKEKVSTPLFSVVMRIGAQANSVERSRHLAEELIHSISSISQSQQNCLIPLSNKGYEYNNHMFNLHMRRSNRLGMILNSQELASFVHYPNKTIVSKKLGFDEIKTKLLPKEAIGQKYTLGINSHNGETTRVTLNDEARLRHTHIIGATGVGKSTLIANMIFEDISQGNGCVLFDPHGDIADDVLSRIPSSRKKDVIIVDPSDKEYSIGFNLLNAQTDAEKIVLSSDLVASFKRHASAWGDNMTAVLSNAINAFLDSSKDGTLIELKRFLLEDTFREKFLKTVDDQSIQYYWKHEYPMMKRGITPLLTRIDTFLRPKIVRYMLAQRSGIDFKACIEEKKIVLIKLPQGLIGEANSYLLGSLFLSKFNQVAQGRQNLQKEKRHPYYIYIDEFEAFITPSILSILSGARKYGIGLILAHQELAQLEETKILNSVISNPNIRICFRLGDMDAKRLESGFSYFEQGDLQSLGIGEAIVRIGSSKNDFNIKTEPLCYVRWQISKHIADEIISNSREKYGMPIAEVIKLLDSQLPNFNKIKIDHKKDKRTPILETKTTSIIDQDSESKYPPHRESIEKQKKSFLKHTSEIQEVRKHRELQNFVRTMAQQRDFKATIEETTDNGGRVDIGLLREDIRIAVEISVTNTLDYEVQNIQKCLDAGYTEVYMLSDNTVHLKNIRNRAYEIIDKDNLSSVKFLMPLEFTSYLDALSKDMEPKKTKRVRGYRVKSNHIDINDAEAKEKNSELHNAILKSLKKGKK